MTVLEAIGVGLKSKSCDLAASSPVVSDSSSLTVQCCISATSSERLGCRTLGFRNSIISSQLLWVLHTAIFGQCPCS